MERTRGSPKSLECAETFLVSKGFTDSSKEKEHIGEFRTLTKMSLKVVGDFQKDNVNSNQVIVQGSKLKPKESQK